MLHPFTVILRALSFLQQVGIDKNDIPELTQVNQAVSWRFYEINDCYLFCEVINATY